MHENNIMTTAPQCTGTGCPIGPRTGLHLVNYHNDRCAMSPDASPGDHTHVYRRYFGTDVTAAITDWGGYDGRSAAPRVARQALDDVTVQLGELNEVFRLEDTNRYVGAVYRPHGQLSRVGLYLSRTIIESAVLLPGFDAIPVNGYWRRDLPDSESVATPRYVNADRASDSPLLGVLRDPTSRRV